jgi:DNA anti-recombination protein RmuC
MEAWKEWLKMLTWLKVKYYLKKSWIWIKAHWEIVLGAILVIFVYATQRAKTSSMSKVLENSRKIHEEEINALHEIHEKEKEDLKKAEDRMIETMKKVEEEYEKSNQELNEKKKKEIESLVKKNKKDPDEITRRLSEITGFEIHVE